MTAKEQGAPHGRQPRPVRMLKTFVAGLDEKLGGGIPEGHVVLVSGTPGTMKSSLAYYILYRNCRSGGIKGAYVSLEQSRRSLAFQMGRLGMAGQDVVSIVDLARVRKMMAAQDQEPWLETLRTHLGMLVEGEGHRLLVIDSLPVLEIMAEPGSRRNQFFHFFEWLRDLNLTTFLISEAQTDSRELHDEEFLADGVFYLSLEKVGKVDIQRRIRCVKMRGMPHNTSVFNLEFRNGGFMITPPI